MTILTNTECVASFANSRAYNMAMNNGRPVSAKTIAKNNESIAPVMRNMQRIPRPPRGFSAHEKKEWNRVAKLLKDAGILTQLDLDCLTHYCRASVSYIELLTEAKKQPRAVKSPTGGVIKNPTWVAVDQQYRKVVELLREMGMTPAARNKMPDVIIQNQLNANGESSEVNIAIEFI